jgi:hypothetical protein
VTARNLPQGRTAEVPGTVSVFVRGGRDALSRIDAGAITAFVDLAGLGPGRYNLPVRIDPSRAFGVSRIEPQVVEVRIR